MIGLREFHVIAATHGLSAAGRCADGRCAHPEHPRPGNTAGPGDDGGGGAMVDLRCPESMGKLLGRTQAVPVPGGMVELACGNCSRRFRRDTTLAVTRVVHRYNLLGELLTTAISLAD